MIFNRSPWTLHLLLLLVAIIFPFVSDSAFVINFGVLALFYAFIGQSWNIAGGFAGQLSFGHVAFFGVGAYASTIVQMRFGFNPWWGLPVAALAGAAAGWLIAVMSFRAGLKGSYFALITLAFAEVFRIVANSIEITGGGLGMLIPMKQTAANFQFGARRVFYAHWASTLFLKRSRSWPSREPLPVSVVAFFHSTFCTLIRPLFLESINRLRCCCSA